MQAITTTSTFAYNYSENTVTSSVLGFSTFALTIAIFLTASMPEAGRSPLAVAELSPVEDSHEDLGFAQVYDYFNERLPRARKKDAYKLTRALFQESQLRKISPGILLSVIEVESSFRYRIVSKAGAIGLMQILPSTAKEVARKYKIPSYKDARDLYDPIVNIKIGAAYIAYLRAHFGQSVHYLAAYNLGPTSMRRRISHGNYELGAVEKYVQKITSQVHLLRNNSDSLHTNKRIPLLSRQEQKAWLLASAN